MKIPFVKSGTALLIVLIAACTTVDTPKSVAEKFMNALNKQDFETAKKYGTEDTGKLLDMMSGLAKMGASADTVSKERKVEMLTEKIEGDKATVTYKMEDKAGEEPLSLVKQDGKWKVAMSKDNMNSAEGGSSMDAGATNTDSTSTDVSPVDSTNK